MKKVWNVIIELIVMISLTESQNMVMVLESFVDWINVSNECLNWYVYTYY